MKTPRSPKPPVSLRARGVQLLSQREHSVSELRQKLQQHARLLDAARTTREADDNGCYGGAEQVEQPGSADELSGQPAAHLTNTAAPARRSALVTCTATETVADTLIWLQAKGYLSDTRFAQSRVYVRSTRFGNLRIRQELAQHQVALTAEAAQALQDSELQRALVVFQRKFGNPLSSTTGEAAKQARFLTQRGFSSDVIRQVLRAAAKATAAKP